MIGEFQEAIAKLASVYSGEGEITIEVPTRLFDQLVAELPSVWDFSIPMPECKFLEMHSYGYTVRIYRDKNNDSNN